MSTQAGRLAKVDKFETVFVAFTRAFTLLSVYVTPSGECCPRRAPRALLVELSAPLSESERGAPLRAPPAGAMAEGPLLPDIKLLSTKGPPTYSHSGALRNHHVKKPRRALSRAEFPSMDNFWEAMHGDAARTAALLMMIACSTDAPAAIRCPG